MARACLCARERGDYEYSISSTRTDHVLRDTLRDDNARDTCPREGLLRRVLVHHQTGRLHLLREGRFTMEKGVMQISIMGM